jgi:hypothetical protein
MNYQTKQNLEIVALVALIIGIVILACVAAAANKADCLASGGHWVEGFVGGEYAYFCKV